MAETFDVRQLVSTVKRTWYEPVFTTFTIRQAQLEFEKLQAENPSCYFQVVKVTKKEEHMEYTPVGV